MPAEERLKLSVLEEEEESRLKTSSRKQYDWT